jgi:hypothetical protein
MQRLGHLLILIALVAVSGCATTPVSFEESLNTNRATRNDITDWPTDMRYRVGLQYANAARKKLDEPDVEIPSDASFDFQVPFALLDYTLGNNVGAGISVVDWFNSGMSENNRYAYNYNRGLGLMVSPNTHYFTFDERPGVPDRDEIHEIWDEAFDLFSAIHNQTGQCYVFGYNEKDQYRLTYSKDVPALHKGVLYVCPHPLFEDRQQRVLVTAWANPYPGVRSLAAVQPQCYKTLRGEDFVDTRDCGIKLADQQAPDIPDSRYGWMELIVTPTEEDPSRFQVLGRFDDVTVVLPPPLATDEYAEFLASSPYFSD